MTDTAWKPTPGRDAMTRDGDRVNVEEHDGYVWAVARDPRRVWTVDPATGRRYFGAGPDHPLDLVADWPDADPLPDAAQHANWTAVEWSASIRPAPSGPVVEETGPVRWKRVPEIVQGDYGRLSIGRYYEPTGSVEVRLGSGAWYWLSKAEILAISETTRQIGEAMEGK